MIKINNVLSNKERKELITLCKPLCVVVASRPAKQTSHLLHTHPDINKYVRLIGEKITQKLGLPIEIKKTWVNEDRGYKKDIFWHNHPQVDLTAVYYMQTLPLINSGTLFEDKFVRCKQNSVLLFPGSIVHGTPSYPFHWIKRYTLAIDMRVDNKYP
tara:strand:- start:42 stop:512 length:471 start_codon:yes stop_codon:yes gene_type:complete